jgi:hypothetical protein
MKKINNLKTLLLIVLAATFSACETVDFGNTNTDPNSPSNSVPSLMLTNVQRGLSGVTAHRTANLYVQYLSNGQYDEESRYQTLNWSTDGSYATLQDIKQIITINSNEDTKTGAQAYGSNGNQIAVATILKVYWYQLMTERWGYLPYSQANDAENNTKPKYDSQEDIYMGLFAELDTALNSMDSGNGPDGDILFGGDMTRWRTFANTIKMVMALRLSNADAATGRSKFNEALSGAISSNSDNIQYTFLSEDTNDNPWQDHFVDEGRKDYLLSDTFVDKLIGSGTNTDPEDPRLPKYAQVSETSSVYVGAPYGQSNSATANYSFITNNIINQGDAPLMIYTYAEVLFARAEAAAWGWTTENASSLYEQGIKASMEQWGVANADSDAYAAANAYSNVDDIAYEKWVSLYLQGYNSWAEWRRFKAMGTEGKIGLIAPGDLLSNATDIPQRHGYSATAASLNENNYNSAVSAQGSDDLDTKLWLFK